MLQMSNLRLALENRPWSPFVKVVQERKERGVRMVLLRFNLPKLGREGRKKILEDVLEESGAEALVEVFWTRSSVLYKDQQRFSAVLMYD